MSSTVKGDGDGRGGRRNQCSKRDSEARAHEDGKVFQGHRSACVTLLAQHKTEHGSSSRDASSTPWVFVAVMCTSFHTPSSGAILLQFWHALSSRTALA